MKTPETISEYWELQGYSKEEAKRIERKQIRYMMNEAGWDDF